MSGKRWANSVTLLVVMLLIALVTGATKIDPEISGNSYGYFVADNVHEAERAAAAGYVDYRRNDYADHFGLEWEKRPGVMKIIRSGPDDFDDIGYPLFTQLLAVNGVDITISGLEKFHNYFFLVVLGLVSLIIFRASGSFGYGIATFLLGLLLKYLLATYVYGWPENRTLAVIFPGVMFVVFYLINQASRIRNGWLLGISATFCGLVIGTIWVMRSSEGMAALIATLVVLAFVIRKPSPKIRMSLFMALGFCAVVFALPSVVSLHKDLKLGQFERITDYLDTTGGHPIWHSVVIGLGRYENALGMTYDDVRAYDIVREKFPGSMHPQYNIHGPVYYQALRKLFFDYIAEHPFEYVTNSLRAVWDTVYFIPYATSTGRYETWYGYLPIKDGVEVEPQHKAPAPVSLVTLRYRYLNLSIIQWLAFGLGCLGIFIAFARRSLESAEHPVTNSIAEQSRAVTSLINAMFVYIVFLAALRIIVPAHGFSLVVAFWLFAAMCWIKVGMTNRQQLVAKFLEIRLEKDYLGRPSIAAETLKASWLAAIRTVAVMLVVIGFGLVGALCSGQLIPDTLLRSFS